MPNREDKSWVLSTALVTIPIVLVVLALWLWPLMRNVYSLPDSAVVTYQKALNRAVPPGTGRVTRTALIEEALAKILGRLSDTAALPQQPSPQLRSVLRYNARLGRWAEAVMTFPRSGRVALFNWGLRGVNLPLVNHVFSRWSFQRIAASHALAKRAGPFADALIMRLLQDPVFVVRLSVMPALYDRRPTSAEMVLLRQWATEKSVNSLAKPRRWKMFLFGRDAVNGTPVLYRMNRQTHLTDTRQFATALLARWSLPTTAPAQVATQPLESAAASMPAAAIDHGRVKSDRAEIKTRMKSLRKAMATLVRADASAKSVKAALAAEYRTLITMATVMPWQKQLSQIMAFNAAMSRWIYLVSQLPPQQRQALFNWARFRTQDVELLRLVMSQQRRQRLHAAAIAPKLHGTEQVWLVHRLLTDPSVTVELTMLHELWKLHPSAPLRNMLVHWTNLEPLPKGHSPQTIMFNGKKYVVNRTISLNRYRTARRIGALLLQRWKRPTP